MKKANLNGLAFFFWHCLLNSFGIDATDGNALSPQAVGVWNPLQIAMQETPPRVEAPGRATHYDSTRHYAVDRREDFGFLTCSIFDELGAA